MTKSLARGRAASAKRTLSTKELKDPTEPKKPKEPPNLSISTIDTRTCPSLSGRSQLTYELGKGSDGLLYVRITGNTGTGFFNPLWASLVAIEEKLSVPLKKDECLTSIVLW